MSGGDTLPFHPSTVALSQVSELRQQLRKRGLPVSGTKPALLQRLRLFQLPRSCVTPAPLCQLGTSLEAVIPLTPLLPSSQSPSSSSSSRMDSPGSSPSQQMFITDRGIPNGILTDSPNGVPEGMLLSSGFSQAVPVTLSGDGGGLTNAVFLAPANTASGTPSPSLPMSCSSPLSCTTPLRSEMEQQREPNVEKKERLRSRSRSCTLSPGDEVSKLSKSPVYLLFSNGGQTTRVNISMSSFIQLCGNSLHPFLQQDPGCSKSKPEAEVETTQSSSKFRNSVNESPINGKTLLRVVFPVGVRRPTLRPDWPGFRAAGADNCQPGSGPALWHSQLGGRTPGGHPESTG